MLTFYLFSVFPYNSLEKNSLRLSVMLFYLMDEAYNFKSAATKIHMQWDDILEENQAS
jgi:hypothetical protein